MTLGNRTEALKRYDEQWGPKFGFLIHDVARLLTTLFDMRLKSADLTRSQWRAIAYVSRAPGISQIKLADQIGVGRMAVTGLLDRLEAKGFIERRADANDGRINGVYCTAKVKKILPEMQEIGNAVMADILEGISETKRRQLFQALTKMYENGTRQTEGS